MNERTPAQIKVIQTWTEDRDALLREIGIHSSELEEKQKANAEAGLAFADLERGIAEAKGRLVELDALEERHRTSVAIDVSELEARKSRLEAECVEKELELRQKSNMMSVVMGMTTMLTSANDTMKDQAAIVDSVVGQLIETSRVALSEIKNTMTEIHTISLEVIEKGTANVTQTNIVLEKLPKYIFELQRPIPVRRMYAAPRGTHIPPDSIAESA